MFHRKSKFEATLQLMAWRLSWEDIENVEKKKGGPQSTGSGSEVYFSIWRENVFVIRQS